MKAIRYVIGVVVIGIIGTVMFLFRRNDDDLGAVSSECLAHHIRREGRSGDEA